jgi:hypothetical protein
MLRQVADGSDWKSAKIVSSVQSIGTIRSD